MKKFNNNYKLNLATLLLLSLSTSTAFAATPLKDDAQHLITNSNTATGGMTTVAIGGQNNKIKTANGWGEAIVGGSDNEISGQGVTPNGIFVSVNSKIGDFDAQGNPVKELNGEKNETNRSTIIGGQNHIVKGYDNIVLGGGNNNNAEGAVIGGNQILGGDNNAILGGMINKIDQAQKTYYTNNNILGGRENTISDTVKNSSILNGTKNTISGTAQHSAIVSGMENTVSGEKSVVLGGYGNNVSGKGSYAIGGVKDFGTDEKNGNTISGHRSYGFGSANTISGSKSYALGNTNTVASEFDYILGESNAISGSHNYIIGSNNTSTGEKVYILGSGVNTNGVANAVVLGDASTAVANAVSVGTATAPRNIKHVADGEISDTSLDAINGSQVTTVESATPTEISVTLDTTKTDHKHYKVGLKKEFKDKIDKIAKEMPDKLTETGLKSKLTGDITSNGGTVTVTGGDDKLFANVNLEVADGAITETKLASAIKTKLDNIPSVALITSSDLTVGNGGDLKTGNVNLAIKDGAIKMKHLGQDVKDAMSMTINNSTDGIGEGKDQAVTGGVIHNYLTQNYYDINKVQDLLDEKVDESSMNKSLTSQTIDITGDGASKLYGAINIEVKDGSITKNKLNKALKDEIDGKISKTDIHNITSSTLTITGGKDGNLTNGDVNIEITNGSITADKLDTNLNNKINSKLSKGDLIGSTTVALTEKDGKTAFSVVDGSIGATQLDDATNNQLKRVGSGFVKSGDNNTITGNVAYDAIKHAKTKVSTTGNYLKLVDKNESDDVEPNSYKIGLDKDALKKDLATGNITGTGITVKGGDNSTFKDVKLAIADNAITTAKVADNAITEDKISDEAVAKFTEKSRETVVAGSDALSVTPKTVAPNTDNQEFVVDLSAKTKATLQQVDTNKTEIAKKINTVDMNGKLTSQSISVTGDGKDKLLKDVNIEVNKTLTNMESISFNNGVSISNKGLNNGGHRITNVATGVKPTDAVNKAQLDAVRNELNQSGKNSNAGIAGAYSAASLGQAIDPGASTFGVGVGTYKGQGAVSVGMSTVSDNGRWILKGNATVDTSGTFGAGGSVNFQW